MQTTNKTNKKKTKMQIKNKYKRMQTNTKNITQPTKQKKKKQIKSKYKQMQANTNKCKQIQTNAYKQNKQHICAFTITSRRRYSYH